MSLELGYIHTFSLNHPGDPFFKSRLGRDPGFENHCNSAPYSAFRLYMFFFFYQYVCSLGIEPTTFCAANAMLYH